MSNVATVTAQSTSGTIPSYVFKPLPVGVTPVLKIDEYGQNSTELEVSYSDLAEVAKTGSLECAGNEGELLSTFALLDENDKDALQHRLNAKPAVLDRAKELSKEYRSVIDSLLNRPTLRQFLMLSPIPLALLHIFNSNLANSDKSLALAGGLVFECLLGIMAMFDGMNYMNAKERILIVLDQIVKKEEPILDVESK